jgi:RNA polymerase primary sigma factor
MKKTDLEYASSHKPQKSQNKKHHLDDDVARVERSDKVEQIHFNGLNVAHNPSDMGSNDTPINDDFLYSEKIANGYPESDKKVKNTEKVSDPLSHYMDGLRKFSLYTAKEEKEEAQKLEHLEIKIWKHVLIQPRLIHILLSENNQLNESIYKKLKKIEFIYKKSTKSDFKNLPLSLKKIRCSMNNLIQSLAISLRNFDLDKEIIEHTLQKARQLVWKRQVYSKNYSYRIKHEDLAVIDRYRREATQIRNKFVRANLRLVVSVARHFHHHRIPFIDLIQEGNLGLLKAVHRFNHKKGFRFSTYAHWWIRQSVERAIINKSSSIRLPVHIIDRKRNLTRIFQQLSHQLGRMPSSAEISEKANMPEDKVEHILFHIKKETISLDECINAGDPRKFLDIIEDNKNSSLEESIIRENSRSKVQELLKFLNSIEKDIIRRRFGLGYDEDQTLDEIGKIYNLSRERVRQIQAQSLSKIKKICERNKIM